MDNVWLTGPNGSQINVGSWIEKSAGVDWGVHDLIRQNLVQNDFVEGARFAYESAAGERRMSLPLIVPSGGVAGLSLDAIEAWLGQMARPGGYVDVKPDGVPTAEMIRFDLVGGDIAHRNYSADWQRIDRRRLSLSLLTQPFGYWPTQILLASAAPASAPLQLTWNPASVIGDAPAQALLQVRKLTATQGTLASMISFSGDALWWSLSRASGATIMLAPSDFTAATSMTNLAPSAGIFSAAVVADSYAPLGFSMQTRVNPSIGAWFPFARWSPGATGTLDSLYRGQPFRLFAYMRTTPSWALPVQVAADEVGGFKEDYLASAYPVATLLPQANASFSDIASSGGGAFGAPAASGFQILDLGEHTFPPVGSGVIGTTGLNWALRLWAYFGATAPGVASPAIELGGLYMLPAGQAGILPRGMIYPTQINIVSTAAGQITTSHQLSRHLTLDTVNDRVMLPLVNVGSALDSFNGVIDDARGYYRGRLPYLTPTNTSLDVGFGGRRWGQLGASNAMLHAPQELLGGSVTYRPRFTFLKGI